MSQKIVIINVSLCYRNKQLAAAVITMLLYNFSSGLAAFLARYSFGGDVYTMGIYV
jgi:hypothetical protein